MESKPSNELKYYEIPIQEQYILNARIRIGKGSKEVYFGKIKNTDKEIAIKLGRKNNNYIIWNGGYFKRKSFLKKEYEIYKRLDGIERIPKIYWYGSQGNYNCLVMDLLGLSLKDLMEYIKKPFSLGTTLKISLQILDILKEIHKKGVVLRYIKPENTTIGKGDNEKNIYLIDFELAKQYIKNGIHISFREKETILGNPYFISINTQCGKQVSRRDDIESLGYNLIYFMNGKLPWSDLKHKEEIIEKKKNTTLDELCKGLPIEFIEFIKYGKEIGFTEEPDYDYLKGLLLKAATSNNIKIDDVEYDWDIYKQKLMEEENNKNKKEDIKENKSDNSVFDNKNAIKEKKVDE